MRRAQRERRQLLCAGAVGAGAALLAGCDRLSNNDAFIHVLRSAESLSRAAQRVVAPRRAMAQEFTPAHIAHLSRQRPAPRDADYAALRDGGFAAYRLTVGGLVEQSSGWSLADSRALPSRTQITRHDCVEGWSCIGRWKGVPRAQLLERARPTPAARYVVFHCFDSMDAGEGDTPDSHYCESIDLDEAVHAQTLLAYGLNGQPLPVANGAPLRLRVERQLGCKHAKYVRDRAGGELRRHPRRTRRLLGRRRLRVVRRNLSPR